MSLPAFSGTRLRELRKARDIRPELLGCLIGRSVFAIYRWENGSCVPSTPMVAALAAALDVPIDDLFTRDPAEVA